MEYHLLSMNDFSFSKFNLFHSAPISNRQIISKYDLFLSGSKIL